MLKRSWARIRTETREIWGLARRRPFAAMLIGLILLGCGVVGYAYGVMPDPSIRVLHPPVPNTGVDADGMTLDRWMTDLDSRGLSKKQLELRGGDPARWVLFYKGQPAALWRPMEKRVWSLSTDTHWFVLRQDCFLNKTADGKVSRAYVGYAGASDERIARGNALTSGTQVILPDVEIPSRTDGCSVKNHRVPLSDGIGPNGKPAKLIPGVWAYVVTVNFYKHPGQSRVRVPMAAPLIEVIP